MAQPVYNFRVVVYFEEGWWLAHCLETDTIGQAKTREAAIDDLKDALSLHINGSLADGNPGNIIQLADPVYWHMFFTAPRSESPPRRIPVSSTTAAFETAEYASGAA